MTQDEKVASLKKAISAGELLTVVYSGGSQPGAKRDISPVRIEDKDVVIAREITGEPTPVIKHFSISKLEIVPKGFNAAAYDPHKKLTEPIQTLTDAYEAIKKGLGETPWALVLNEKGVGAYKKLADGKLEPIADVLLSPATQHNLVISMTGATEEDVPTGEWAVRGPIVKDPWGEGLDDVDERSYKKLSKAVDRFIKVAKTEMPS